MTGGIAIVGDDCMRAGGLESAPRAAPARANRTWANRTWAIRPGPSVRGHPSGAIRPGPSILGHRSWANRPARCATRSNRNRCPPAKRRYPASAEQPARASTSASKGSPTQRCRLFTSRTGANTSSSGHGNAAPSCSAVPIPPLARTRSSMARSGARSAMKVAAASHSRHPRTTCPICATRPPRPSLTSTVTRSPQSGLSTVADPCGRSSRAPGRDRRAAARIAS